MGRFSLPFIICIFILSSHIGCTSTSSMHDFFIEGNKKNTYSIASDTIDLKYQMANRMNNNGEKLCIENKYNEALDSFKIAYEILKNLNPKHQKLSGAAARNIGRYYAVHGKTDTALTMLNLALEHFSKSQEDCNVIKGQTFDNIGTMHLYRGEFHTAIKYYHHSIALLETKLNEGSPEFGGIFNNLALLYNHLGNDDSTSIYNKKALNIFLNKGGNMLRHVANCYNMMGDVALKNGDLYRAEIYYDLSLSYHANYVQTPNLVNAATLINLGNLAIENKEFEKALFYFKKYKIVIDSIFKDKLTVNHAQNELANAITYHHWEKYDSCIYYYKKAMNIFEQIGETGHLDYAKAKANLGRSYIERGDLETGKNFIEESIIDFRIKYGEKHLNMGHVYTNMAKYYEKLENFDTALFFLNKAINSYNYEAFLNQQYEKINTIQETATAFYNLGKEYEKYYSKEGGVEKLKKAYETYQEGIEYATILSISYLDDRSKFHLLNAVFPLFEGAIKTNMGLCETPQNNNCKESIFSSIEQTKSLVLLEAINKSDAINYSGIPKSIIEKEKRIKKNIASLEIGRHLSPTENISIDSALLSEKESYDSLIRQIERTYPKYYDLKYSTKTTPLSYLQDSLLAPNQSLLEYFVGDSSIFFFHIQPGQEPQLVEITKDFPLEEWVQMFREALSSPNLIEQYIEYGQKLYNKLVEPVAESLPERVVVVPDGVLGYLPFGALLSRPPLYDQAFATYPFLVRNHQFSYCYSATLLQEMKEKQHHQTPQKNFAAFAPEYDGDTALLAIRFAHDPAMPKRLLPLPSAKVEVANASNRMGGGDIYEGKTALKDTFGEVAHLYQTLHLSTHGRADNRSGDYAFLAFSQQKATNDDGLLYVRDLYNLQLNADLVVLSACETGTGKLRRGEGIISLARAFAYAGAKSILTTLWEVNDARTAEIMDYFYKYLAAGKDKDEALRLAQLEYLKRKGGTNVELHPYYWAAFIPIGDMRPIGK